MLRAAAVLAIGLLTASTAFAQEARPGPVEPAQPLDAVEKLLVEQDFEKAIRACEELLDRDPEASPAVLPLLARAHEGSGAPGKAAATVRRLIAEHGPTVPRIEDLARLAAACAEGQDPEAALEAYEFVLDSYPSAMDHYLDQNPTGYAANRSVLDQGSEYDRLAREMAHAAGDDADRSYAALLRVFRAYPGIPQMRETALRLASRCARSEDWAGTLAFCRRVVDYGGDRTRNTTTRLTDNQAYLNAISTPNSEATLREVLGLMDRACAALGTADPAGAERIAELAAQWAEAESAAYGVLWVEEWAARDEAEARALAAARYPAPGDGWVPNSRPPLPRWQALIQSCHGSALEPQAQFALGQWLHYRGLYAEAQELYGKARETEHVLPGLSDWLSFEMGELAAAQGRFADACTLFAQCQPEVDKPLAAEAGLRRAECLEFRGLVAEALAANEALDADSEAPVPARRTARYAARRLSQSRGALAPLRGSANETGAVYLGQDRITQGDWLLKGRDLFVLCACHGSSDISGGSLAPVSYGVGTTDPERRAHWWHGGQDADPSMIYDPQHTPRGPRNWDDGGEKYTPATGPDLLVTIPVPQGASRLSLYFVNDRNYYEPSRRYTIYVTDAESGAVLAAAPLRDFVSGVYAHFRVSGPRNLCVRIWRNLSLNTLLAGVFLDDLSKMPNWSGLRAGPLSDGAVGGAAVEHWSDPEAAWSAYRELWAEGGGALEERRALEGFAATLTPVLGGYRAGRAIEAVAGHLLDLGFVGKSCVLQDRALALMAGQSPRRYADALLRSVEAYGRRIPYYDGAPTFQEGAAQQPEVRLLPVWQAVALPRLEQYAELVGTPRSLVAPEDLIALGRRYWRQDQHALARRCFELAAPDGDVQRLEAGDTYQYAKCLSDAPLRALRIQVLRGLLGRDEPLPVPRAHLQSDLVLLSTAEGRLDEAETEMQVLAAMEAAAHIKHEAALSLALAFWREKEVTRARKWAEYALSQLPEGRSGAAAETILRSTQGENAPQP